MTCIVGLVEGDKVYIGGDSATGNGYITRPSAVPKVFHNGPFVIGFTDSWRMGQILQHHLSLNELKPPGDSAQEFMVKEFIEAARKALKEYGYARLKDNEETAGQFLVGYSGHLYCIDSDYQVNETIDGMDACGCGAQIALGALYAGKHSIASPYRRINIALEAAAHYSGDVRPPFRIEVLE